MWHEIRGNLQQKWHKRVFFQEDVLQISFKQDIRFCANFHVQRAVVIVVVSAGNEAACYQQTSQQLPSQKAATFPCPATRCCAEQVHLGVVNKLGRDLILLSWHDRPALL